MPTRTIANNTDSSDDGDVDHSTTVVKPTTSNDNEEKVVVEEGEEENDDTATTAGINKKPNVSFEDEEIKPLAATNTNNNNQNNNIRDSLSRMATFRGRYSAYDYSSGDDDDNDDNSNYSKLHKQESLRDLLSWQSPRTSKASSLTPTIPEEEEEKEEEERVFEVIEQKTKHRRNTPDGQYTIIAFINTGSGGGMGEAIHKDLSKMLGGEFVFDLQSCYSKGNLPRDILIKFALDANVRVLACGGDGTQGWILSEIDQVWIQQRRQLIVSNNNNNDNNNIDTYIANHLPLAIMPLGTGNDLSRMFNWGPKYNPNMRKESFITKIEHGKQVKLDRWRCVIIPFERLGDDSKDLIPAMLHEEEKSKEHVEEKTNTIKSMTKAKSFFINNAKGGFTNRNSNRSSSSGGGGRGGRSSSLSSTRRLSVIDNIQLKSTQIFDGVFNNYLSFGFDARIAFAFHHERQEHPERFTSTTKNKLIYVEKTLMEGGLFRTRQKSKPPKLHDKIRILIGTTNNTNKNDNDNVENFEEIPIPSNCRGIALLNIQSYAAGNQIVDTAKSKCDDEKIEIVFMRSCTRMAACLAFGAKFKIAAQVNRILIRILEPIHCQVDGEPWLQSEGIYQISYHGCSPILRNESTRSCCSS